MSGLVNAEKCLLFFRVDDMQFDENVHSMRIR